MSPRILALLPLLLLVASCGGSTVLERTWTDPDPPEGSVGRIAVVGLSPRADVRETFERLFTERLVEAGADAVESLSLTSDTDLDRKALQALVAEHRLGAVLTAVALPVHAESQEVDLPTPYRPARAGDLFEYVLRTRRELPAEGLVRPEQPFLPVEARLYRAGDGRLLWAGISRSQNDQDLAAFVRDYAKVVAFQLQALDFLP